MKLQDRKCKKKWCEQIVRNCKIFSGGKKYRRTFGKKYKGQRHNIMQKCSGWTAYAKKVPVWNLKQC
jgi:hypothetical protein